MVSAEALNWEPILWVAGVIVTVFFTIISSLLAWIGILYKRGNDKIEIKIDTHQRHLEKHDEEIHDLELSNREILTIIKTKLKIP